MTELDKAMIRKLGITTREYEILSEIEKGLSNKEISNTLNISKSTIKTHTSNSFNKLDQTSHASSTKG